MPPYRRDTAASAAASSKDENDRGSWGGVRWWSACSVSVNALIPNIAVRTEAAAPDWVECPEVYVGNGGVVMYGSQLASKASRMYVTGRSRLVAYFVNQHCMKASWTAMPTRANASAASDRERRSVLAIWPTIAIQWPGGVPVVPAPSAQ